MSAPRKRTAPPASSAPDSGLSPRDQRIQRLTGIGMEDAIAILQTRVGELETQRLMDGTIIARLVARIQELDPGDPVAADAAAQQEDTR